MSALAQAGVEPERVFAEYAPHQFEIPVAAAEGLTSADRAVVLREVVREVARRQGTRASFAPLLDPQQAGNGVHVHLSLLDTRGDSLLYDADGPARLSELGGHFAADPASRARAQRAHRSKPRLGRAPSAPPLERRSGVPRAAQPRGAAAHPAGG